MKQYFLMLLAGLMLCAATVLSSATSNASSGATDPFWEFTGTSVSDQNNPAFYVEISDPDEPGCTGNTMNCVIQAPAQTGNPLRPDLSGGYTLISEKN